MLALREFFWEESAWTGATAPPPAEIEPGRRSEGSGGGGHKRSNDYMPHSDAYWLLRGDYLRRATTSLSKTIKRTTPITNDNETIPLDIAKLGVRPPGGAVEDRLPQLEAQLAEAYAALDTAQDATAMHAAMRQINQLQLDISKNQQQNYNRAIALQLLSKQ